MQKIEAKHLFSNWAELCWFDWTSVPWPNCTVEIIPQSPQKVSSINVRYNFWKWSLRNFELQMNSQAHNTQGNFRVWIPLRPFSRNWKTFPEKIYSIFKYFSLQLFYFLTENTDPQSQFKTDIFFNNFYIWNDVINFLVEKSCVLSKKGFFVLFAHFYSSNSFWF